MTQTDRIDHPTDGAATDKKHSMAVAVIVAVCATLVVAMVFSMADRTRAVAGDANVVHGIDLASSQVDRITHGIGAAALLSTTDRVEAQARLTAAQRDLAVASAIVGSATVPDIDELSDFVTAATDAVDGLQQNPSPADMTSRLDLVAERSDLLTNRYADLAGERLEAIDRADRLLSRFGALGGGAVAFVIPVLAIYLHLRLRDGEQRAHNATIAYHWRLTATEQRFGRVLDRLAAALDLLEVDQAAGTRQLRSTLTGGQIEQGRLVLKPEPVDVERVVQTEPELPGLPRRTAGLADTRCLVDPTTFTAALSTIETTLLEAGANAVELTLTPSSQAGSAALSITADGVQTVASTDPRLAGALPTIRMLLSSGGLDHTVDETGSTWTLFLPVDTSATDGEAGARTDDQTDYQTDDRTNALPDAPSSSVSGIADRQ